MNVFFKECYLMSDLIELLYRQHKQLRALAETMWNDNNELHLTASEWYVLKSISEGKVTAPELVKQLEISKQGVHKFLTSLQEKGLIATALIKESKVQKLAHLTDEGKEIIKKSKELDGEISNRVRASIGNEQYEQLIALLQQPFIGK